MKSMLITGASSGIGAATAILAAQNGWRVFACGRSKARLEQLSDQHPQITTLAFDVTDKSACQQILSSLSPDVVILNAGNCEYVEADRLDSELFRRVFEINFFGAVHCVEALQASLKPGAQLIFIDSLARMLPFPRSQAYGASKAALHYFARSLQVDLPELTVKTVSPGFVRTPLTAKNDFHMPMQISAGQAAESILASVNKGQRQHYFPALFAWCIRFLASLPDSWQTRICRGLKHKEQSHV